MRSGCKQAVLVCARISVDHPIAAPMLEASPVLEELFFADASSGVIIGQPDDGNDTLWSSIRDRRCQCQVDMSEKTSAWMDALIRKCKINVVVQIPAILFLTM